MSSKGFNPFITVADNVSFKCFKCCLFRSGEVNLLIRRMSEENGADLKVLANKALDSLNTLLGKVTRADY